MLLPSPEWLNSGNNAWQLAAATFVGLQSIPGLTILYGGIVIPPSVVSELMQAATPRSVRIWMENLPEWVTVKSPQKSMSMFPSDLGPGERITPQDQEAAYPLSNCISCTICMEVCPQLNDATGFVGTATIAQAKLFNMDPSGAVLKEDRLRALAGDGGVQECGFAQNCVQACPKQHPLTEAISDMGRDVFVQKVKDLFTR